MARILDMAEVGTGTAIPPVPVARYVGRAGELRELRSALEAAQNAAGSLTLICGEAGAGKTTTCELIAAEASERGFLVLWGRAWESGGAPAYWLWTQVMRPLLDGFAPTPAETEHALAHLLPELDPASAITRPSVDASPQASFTVYDAVRGYLARVARQQPLLLLLDDVHAADPSSLLLLSFLAQQVGSESIALVAAHRDPERLEPAAAGPLAEAAKHGRTLRLGGFDESVIGELAEHGRLAGAAAGVPLPLPAGIREAVSRRIQALGRESADLLEICSVMGREFSLASLAAVAGRRREEVLLVLDSAASAGLVAPAGVGGRWRFAHAIVNETLYAGIPSAARMQLHRRVGESIEELYGDEDDAHVAELALHFVAAAPRGDTGKAVSYARRAAESAIAKLAWEDAAAHLERALETLELAPDLPTRLDVLLRLGYARQGAGETDASRAVFEQAASAARRLRLPRKLAEAALGRAGIFGIVGDADRAAIDLLTEAIDALGDADPVMRVRLQSRLALELRFTDEVARRDSLVEEALAAARELGRDDAIIFALAARHFTTRGSSDPAHKLRDASEAVRLGERLRDSDPILIGAGLWRATALVEVGDVEAARLEIDQLAERGERLRLPWARWRAHAARALMALVAGELETAERLAGESLALGQPIQAPAALQVFGGQLLALRLDQGRLEEIEPAAKAMVAQEPNAVSWRATLALVQAQLDRREDAARQLDHLAQHDFEDLPDNDYLGSTLALAAGVAAYLGDQDRCRLLYDLLAPFDGRCIVAGYGTATLGPASHWRGLLAAAAGRPDVAAEHFASAVDLERRMAARPYLARTELAWAGVEAERGNAAAAAERAEAALALAREVGMPVVAEGCATLLSRLGPRGAAEARPGAAVFRRDGDFWTIGLGTRTTRLRDSKGLGYIATLLRNPGVEIHALELVAGPDPAVRAAGDAGPLLDDEAKRAYRERLEELQAEIEHADEWRDPERAAQAREELDFVVRELAGAVGLGGRDRKGSSDAERARVNVTRAIRSALRKIEAEDPALGEHLLASVKTGTFCSYVLPRTSVSWHL